MGNRVTFMGKQKNVREFLDISEIYVQPSLNPGDKFEYTSGTPLSTPSGFMEGYYEMETKSGNKFDASIPLFSLDSPYISNKLN